MGFFLHNYAITVQVISLYFVFLYLQLIPFLDLSVTEIFQ